MPVPDEAQMDTLFDDLRPQPSSLNLDRSAFEPSGGPSIPPEVELGELPGETFSEELPAPDADQAYLDAVAFQGDDEPELSEGRAGVPEAQKSRFFLNPKAFINAGKSMAEDSKDRQPAEAAESQELERPSQEGGLPPLSEEVPELPPMPVPSEEAPRSRIYETREKVPGQDPTKVAEARVLYLMAAASVAILVGTGVWGYFLATAGGQKAPYAVQMGQTHQLALQDDLDGHYVSNVPSGQRLFVVNGEVENLFPGVSRVRWIRVKGTVFADRGQTQPLGVAFAYVGNLLKDSELTHWELPAIKAYHGFINGRQDLNFEIAPSAKVPYQLVFAAVGERVERTVAEIVSYHLDGQAIFIDQP
jgi:hypothetical protein